MRKKLSSPLTCFGRTFFFPPMCVLWSGRKPDLAWTTSLPPSLVTLMYQLQKTRARIRQEQIDRERKRKNELRFWQRRENRIVRKETEPLLQRAESLSCALFESQRAAFILRDRLHTLSRSYLLLSRLCFLLCVCLALLVVHQSVDLSARHGSNNQMDIQGRQWKDF